MQDFTSTHTPNGISCTLSSTLANIDRAIACFKEFLDSKPKITVNKFEIHYAIREALNNAVIHGNQKNDLLQVECTLEINRKILTISVTDEGKGFDWRNQLHKKQAGSDATSGRGLESMFMYGFDVQFNDSGNTLYLTKKIM
ncbi:MAG: ATP-binding protein [Desulfobulbaceae bacterium]|nr:ATP-binding protein [Desulfobulbaceae bacterium]